MSVVKNTQRLVALSKKTWRLRADRLVKTADPSLRGCYLGLVFTDNARIAKLNSRYRGKDGPTDVLSFTLHDGLERLSAVRQKAEVLETKAGDERLLQSGHGSPPAHLDASLGEIVISVEYVLEKLIEEEEEEEEMVDITKEEGRNRKGSGARSRLWGNESGPAAAPSSMPVPQADRDLRPRCNEGGGGALDRRLCLLLVHGVCHILGHDHEDDDEWRAMAAEEERLLRESGIELLGRRDFPRK